MARLRSHSGSPQLDVTRQPHPPLEVTKEVTQSALPDCIVPEGHSGDGEANQARAGPRSRSASRSSKSSGRASSGRASSALNADATNWPTILRRAAAKPARKDVEDHALNGNEPALVGDGREDWRENPDVFGPPRPRRASRIRAASEPRRGRRGACDGADNGSDDQDEGPAAFARGSPRPAAPPRPPRPPMPQEAAGGGGEPSAPLVDDVWSNRPAANMPARLRERLEQRRRTEVGDQEESKLPPLPARRQGQPQQQPQPLQQRQVQTPVRAPPAPPAPTRAASAPSSDVRPNRSRPNKTGDDDEKGGRQMFDKNTLRDMHRDLFSGFIERWRQSRELQAEVEGEEEEEGEDGVGGGESVRVFMRKRPLFEKERAKGEYDVLTMLSRRKAALHSCQFQADLKTPFINHHAFKYDCVFDTDATNEDVYEATARSLVHGALREEKACTMFMFGQTGSGKTHTMSAIEELAARDLFEDPDQPPRLSVTFVELRGNRVFDLLAEGIPNAKGRRGVRQRPELRLREQRDGSFTAEGACSEEPATPGELARMLRMAHSRRATSATDANDTSSRSHAVCMIQMLDHRGQLLLIDCAGTERRKDSMFHSKERQQEGAEINASLHALKECLRFRNRGQLVPNNKIRESALTKILSEVFARGQHSQLAVICTASPCASDTEHTLTTLRTGVSLCETGTEQEERQVLLEYRAGLKKPRPQHPKAWTPEQVRDWIENLGRFQVVLDSLPSNTTGQMLVRFTEGRCVQLCGNERLGKQFFGALHRVMQASSQG